MHRKNAVKFLTTIFLVLILASAMATWTQLSVDEPDGTSDNTSGYYTMDWTPSFDDANREHRTMIEDRNTISCYADNDNSGYDQTYTIMTSYACCDTNNYKFNIFGWVGRPAGSSWYIWCMNDQNSDMNAYSSGQFTIVQYTGGDVGPIAIDFAGLILKGIADNIGAVAVVLVITIIVIFLFDVLTGMIGIIAKIRNLISKR